MKLFDSIRGHTLAFIAIVTLTLILMAIGDYGAAQALEMDNPWLKGLLSGTLAIGLIPLAIGMLLIPLLGFGLLIKILAYLGK